MRLRKKPILCNYYLTYRCNAKCGFCNIWERPSPYASLSVIEDNLKSLKILGVKVIDFTGGEPLLHHHIGEILALAKRYGFITTLTTNCLLYPKKAKEIKGLVDMLHFSLDYFSREKHNESRGVECYDHFLQSLEIAKKIGERPDVLFTVFNDNIQDLIKVYTVFCESNDFVMLINPVFGYDDIEGGLTKKNLKVLQEFSKKKLVYLNDAFIELRNNGGNQIDAPVCKAQSTSIVISPDNQLVTPCYHLGEKTIPLNGDLHEVYFSDEVEYYKENEGRLSACQGCEVNCYMQPSFAVEINRYFWKALPSTLKYNRLKGTWKNLF